MIARLASMTPAELERYAVEWRAQAGYVHHLVWYALTDEARDRLRTMSRTAARRMLRPTPRRASTATIDAVALADLLERSAAP